MSDIVAEADIVQMIALDGRGVALVLGENFSGSIPSGGRVEGGHGTTPYSGPEFIDYRAQRKAAVAVIVDSKYKELFAQGERVRFYKRN